MPKKILANVMLLLAANLLIKPFWILGIDRTVQNTVGNEAYGQYMVLFNMSLLFTMLLDFGINNYTSTFIAKHQQLLRKKFAALFPLKLVFSAAYLLITLLFGLMYGMTGKPLLLLMIVSFNQVLLFFVLFFRANITGLQWFKTEAFLSIADRSFMILVAGSMLLLLTHQFTITHFIVAQTLSYGAAAIIAFIILLKPLQGFYIKFNRMMMWSMVRKSGPYALLALLMTIYMRSDYLIMKKLLPDGDMQNGIYAVANRLLEAANMLAAIVAGLFLPLFSNMIKKKEDTTEVIKMGMQLLIVHSACVAAVAWFYNLDIMMLLSKTSPVESAPVFKFVMLSFVAMCVMYIFGTLLTSNGNLRILNRLAFVALIINIGMNLWLLPLYGSLGAAISMACTHGFIAITNTYFAKKELALSIDGMYLAKFLSVLILSVVSVFVCSQLHTNFWIAAMVSGVVAILMLLFTRLLKLAHFKQLLQRGG